MSLIEEALRRQQEEVERSRAAQGLPPDAEGMPRLAPPTAPQPAGTPPPAEPVAKKPPRLKQIEPAPTLEAPTREAPRSRARAWPSLIGTAALVLLLAAGGIWLVYFAFSRWQGATPPTAGAAKEAGPPLPAIVLPEPERKDGVKPPAKSERPVQPASARVGTGAPKPPVGGSVVPPASPPPAPEVTPPPMRPAAELPPAARAGGRAMPRPRGDNAAPAVEWPEMKLTGVIGKGVNGSVMLNGQVVDVGASINGMRIVEIVQQGAQIEYKGETRLVRVRGAIE